MSYWVHVVWVVLSAVCAISAGLIYSSGDHTKAIYWLVMAIYLRPTDGGPDAT